MITFRTGTEHQSDCQGVDPRQVAAVLAGIASIGSACRAFEKRGWQSTLAGNRITVADRVTVRFIDENVGMESGSGARWFVYESAQCQQVWVVGAGVR